MIARIEALWCACDTWRAPHPAARITTPSRSRAAGFIFAINIPACR
jgi:hypothetical protein